MTTDRTITGELKATGYDAEEEYFFRHNKELIEKMRAHLDDARRARAQTDSGATHWMVCPKCGGAMGEREVMGLKGDVCTSCQGIFFDHGELEMLTRTRKEHGMLDTLKEMLVEATKPRPSSIAQFPV